MSRHFRIAPLLAAALALAGCGASDTVHVTGTLTKGGAAYAPPEGQKVGVTLYAVEVKGVTAGEPFQAEWQEAGGTFHVPGPDGRGVPPGKYRVAIVQTMRRDALASLPPRRGKGAVSRETDLLKDRFGPDTSPVVRDIRASGELAIDLDRPAGG